MAYLQNMREKKEFNIDHVKLGEYFPLNVVIDGTFKIFQTLLNLEFTEVKEEKMYQSTASVKSDEDKSTLPSGITIRLLLVLSFHVHYLFILF